MPERATTTMRADALPPEFSKLIRPRPMPSDMVEVTLAVREPTEAEFIANIRAGIDRGRADVAAGRVVDGEEMFARLRAKHFPEDVK